MKLKRKLLNHDHSNKYIATPEINMLTSENFAAISKQANLASKSNIADFVKMTYFDNKLLGFNKRTNSNKTKHFLSENELKILQTFDSSFCICQNYFNNDGAQLYILINL